MADMNQWVNTQKRIMLEEMLEKAKRYSALYDGEGDCAVVLIEDYIAKLQ